MIDYTNIAMLAQAAVGNAGRSITIIKLAVTKDDSAKPWEGTTTPRSAPLASISDVIGVFVSPSSLVKLGHSTLSDDFIKRAEQVIIFAPGPTLTEQIEEFDEVIDGTTNWRITGVEKLTPGPATVLYFIGVAR